MRLLLFAVLLGLTGAGVATVAAQKTCPCSTRCQCGCNEGQPCRCGNPPVRPAPIIVPPPAKPQAPAEQDFGVDRDKLTATPKYTRKGKECSKQEAVDAVGKALPDDSKLLRLTVISADEGKRKAVLNDLLTHPSLSPLKPQLVVQTYAPSHWAVKDAGFKCDGECVIYLQRPDGKVLHRQDEYRGPEKLAEAIRKADPTYDPKKDPDANKAVQMPFGLDKIPQSYLLLGGAALAYLLWRRK